MDWRDRSRVDRFAYEMIDPHNLTNTRGWMRNVTSASITQGYYSDTRISGKLEGVDTGYIVNSLIRIYHYVDAENYVEILGTFFVNDLSVKVKGGLEIESFELTSMLTRISNDYLEHHYAYGNGTSYLDILKSMLTQWDIDFEVDDNVAHRYVSGSRLYECEDSKLSTLYDVCDVLNARMDIAPNGVVTIKKYILPSKREPIETLSTSNMTITSEITIDEPRYDAINRILCHYKKDDADVSAVADVSAEYVYAYANSGVRRTQKETIDECQQPYFQNLQQIAKNKLADLEGGSRTKEFNCVYFPCSMGDIVTLRDSEGTKKYMLQERDIDLKPAMPCAVKIKEIYE